MEVAKGLGAETVSLLEANLEGQKILAMRRTANQHASGEPEVAGKEMEDPASRRIEEVALLVSLGP